MPQAERSLPGTRPLTEVTPEAPSQSGSALKFHAAHLPPAGLQRSLFEDLELPFAARQDPYLARYHVKPLENGLRVHLIPTPAYEKSSIVCLSVPLGSRHEGPLEHGFAHLVEHLSFAALLGNKRDLDLFRQLGPSTRYVNARTTKESTAFIWVGTSDRLEVALTLFAKILLNDEATYSAVQSHARLNRLERLLPRATNNLIGQLFEQALFGEHPLAHSVYSHLDHVPSPEALVSFRARAYHPSVSHLTIAGDLPPGASHLAQELFGSIQTENAVNLHFEAAPLQLPVSSQLVVERNEAITEIQLGFPTLSFSSPQIPELCVLDAALGGTKLSRLSLEIREKMGLAYEFSSGLAFFRDCGYWAVSFKCLSEYSALALEAVKNELSRVAKDGISEQEFEFAKECCEVNLREMLERPEPFALSVAEQAMFLGRVHGPKETLDRIAELSLNDFNKFLTATILPSRFTAAIIGKLP